MLDRCDKKELSIPSVPPFTSLDCWFLVVLLTLGILLGTYLIVTSRIIAQDGAFYLYQARSLFSSVYPVQRADSLGYPLLVHITYVVGIALGLSHSSLTWIYSAQITTLFCRILTLAVLYLFGRLFIGSKKSFIALLVLLFLPYPAHLGSDALRDWPILSFVSLSLLFLLSGMIRHQWWRFAVAGLTAGLGFSIHPISAQGVFYGLAWLIYCLRYRHDIKRSFFLVALFALISGFLIAAAPGVVWQGRFLPQRFDPTFASEPSPITADSYKIVSDTAFAQEYSCRFDAVLLLRGLRETIERLSESLMWFFLLPAILGFLRFFRTTSPHSSRFLLLLFLPVNLFMVLFRYAWLEPAHVNHRYILGITAILCFFIPSGFETMARIISGKRLSSRPVSLRYWPTVFLIVGIGICLPKLLCPIRYDKTGYREAADWLRRHSPPQSVVAVPDHRIALYADRPGIYYYLEPTGGYPVYHIWRDNQLESTINWPESIAYAVEILRSNRKPIPFGRKMEEPIRFAIHPKNAETGWVIVYRMPIED
ncbi:MAG: glycosyltransferase family 39 protein [Sedimentisphaerales bacterium]|nr:glycosyltransferase family 39 protein [Sedimentisphaerales bacterium]